MKPTASLFNPDPNSGYLVVFINGKQFTISCTDPQFDGAVSAFKAEEWDKLYDILDPANKIKTLYAKYDQIEVKDGNVFVFGDSIHTLVADRIIQFLSKGIDCLPVFKFLTKLNSNPSKRAVDELYTFLEHKNLPITENGNFLAYKAVREDYTDVHSGKFSNVVGEVLSMPRNKVDDNKDNGCSYGFHAGTLEYASGFRPYNGKMMIVEIDPSDVVSIPTDSECQKLRTCKYKVVGEYEYTLTDLLYESKYKTDTDPYVESEWDEEDCEGCEGCEYCGEDCGYDDYTDEPAGGCMGDTDAEDETPWHNTFQKVEMDDLLSILFRNRMPAQAMKLRKANINEPVSWFDVFNVLGSLDTKVLYDLWYNQK